MNHANINDQEDSPDPSPAPNGEQKDLKQLARELNDKLRRQSSWRARRSFRMAVFSVLEHQFLEKPDLDKIHEVVSPDQIYRQKIYRDRKQLDKPSIEYMTDIAKRIPYLRILPTDVVHKILHEASTIWAKDNDVIYKEEDIVTFMYIVLSGSCTIYKKVRMLDHTFKIEGKRDIEEDLRSRLKRISASRQAFVGVLNFTADNRNYNEVCVVSAHQFTRQVFPGHSFGEGKFLPLQSLESSSIESLALFVKKFQNKPIDHETIEDLSTRR